VYQDELVAGRVGVGQREDANAGPCLRGQGREDVRVLFLDPDHALGSARPFHGHSQAPQHGAGLVVHEFLVLVQQRFALGAVDDDQWHLGAELDCGREPRAAGADDAEFFNPVAHVMDSDREYT
jgi:hypothetical protein